MRGIARSSRGKDQDDPSEKTERGGNQAGGDGCGPIFFQEIDRRRSSSWIETSQGRKEEARTATIEKV